MGSTIRISLSAVVHGVIHLSRANAQSPQSSSSFLTMEEKSDDFPTLRYTQYDALIANKEANTIGADKWRHEINQKAYMVT